MLVNQFVSLRTLSEVAILTFIYGLHTLILPSKVGFKCKHDYRAKFARNLLLVVELAIFRTLVTNPVLDIFVLCLSAFIIISSLLQMLFSTKIGPEFVLISTVDDIPNNRLARYRWYLSKDEKVDLDLLKQILEKVKPDALLLEGMSPPKVRTILRNSTQTKVFSLVGGEVQKLTAMDLIRRSNLYVESKTVRRLGVVFQGTKLDESVKRCFASQEVQWINMEDELNLITSCDAVVDLTCLNGHKYPSDRADISDRVIQEAEKCSVPVLIPTPAFCQDRASEVYIRVYEVLTQQYKVVKIVRIPYLLFDEVKLQEDLVQNWGRIDDLMVYINYAASIHDQQILELCDGEYFFNHDLKLLIEEINRI